MQFAAQLFSHYGLSAYSQEKKNNEMIEHSLETIYTIEYTNEIGSHQKRDTAICA